MGTFHFILFFSATLSTHRPCLGSLLLSNMWKTVLKSARQHRYFTLCICHGRSVLLESTVPCRMGVLASQRLQSKNYLCCAKDHDPVRLKYKKPHGGISKWKLPLFTCDSSWQTTFMKLQVLQLKVTVARTVLQNRIMFGKFDMIACIDINVGKDKLSIRVADTVLSAYSTNQDLFLNKPMLIISVVLQ